MDEFMAIAYHRTNKLPVVIARFFNTVGPRQTGRYGMVIPRLVKQALTNQPLTVYGDGSQTRTFTHVQDAVAAMLKLINNPESVGEVVNIGGDQEVSILTLANQIKDKTGSCSEIQLVPYEDIFPRDFEDMQRRVPSTIKLQKLTGFRPTIDLDKILDDVIAYQKTCAES
jgi:UDP-glucose 4-epimerase